MPNGEVAEVALDSVALYVEVVGLGGCEHLVAVVYVVVLLLHCFGQLFQHLAVAVSRNRFQTFCLLLHLFKVTFYTRPANCDHRARRAFGCATLRL